MITDQLAGAGQSQNSVPKLAHEDEAMHQGMQMTLEESGRRIDELEHELYRQRRINQAARAALDIFERDEPDQAERPSRFS